MEPNYNFDKTVRDPARRSDRYSVLTPERVTHSITFIASCADDDEARLVLSNYIRRHCRFKKKVVHTDITKLRLSTYKFDILFIKYYK